jgi:uncharacterized protein (TIGR02391 family)
MRLVQILKLMYLLPLGSGRFTGGTISRAMPAAAHLHPKIVKRCKVHLDNGQYDDAVLVAMKLVETELRETAGLPADDVGVHLASKALGKDGVLVLPRAKTMAEQEAVHQLFRGALGFFKNPLSHRFLDETDPHYTFLTLGFASILLTLIQQLERHPRSDAP